MYKVLVAEDETRIRKGLIAGIPWQECGCTVVCEAENGREGVEFIKRFQPDIVVADLNMPIMSGMDMLSETIEEYKYAAIILTGYGEFEYARSALRLGAIDFLTKPLQKEELISALKKAGKYLEEQRMLRHKSGSSGSSLKQSVLVIPAQVGSERVRKCMLYIEENYRNKISINDLVEPLNTSSGYLNQLFKENTDYTFNSYLNRYRILKAMDLLDTDVSRVYEVGEAVGIPDYKYFVSVFEKYAGMTPTEYRKAQSMEEGEENA